MHKVAKNLTRYTVYVIMFIHVHRVFVIVISLFFLDLLLLLCHLLSNILAHNLIKYLAHNLISIATSHHVLMKDFFS